MRRTMALVAVIGLGAVGACLPFSMSNGNIGSLAAPWEIRTQYGWWDAKVFNYRDNKWVLENREDSAGGNILNLRFLGFSVNPSRDWRTWTAEEWWHYYQGMSTQTWLTVEVRNAGGLSNGDEIEFDSESTSPPPANEPAIIDYTYHPASRPLHPMSEYPDSPQQMGSKVKIKLKVNTVQKEAGPMGYINGTVDYEVAKADNDPDEVIEGKFSLMFNAQLVTERIAECNHGSQSYQNGTYSPDACDYMGN